jgi:hypothetical protein
VVTPGRHPEDATVLPEGAAEARLGNAECLRTIDKFCWQRLRIEIVNRTSGCDIASSVGCERQVRNCRRSGEKKRCIQPLSGIEKPSKYANRGFLIRVAAKGDVDTQEKAVRQSPVRLST